MSGTETDSTPPGLENIMQAMMEKFSQFVRDTEAQRAATDAIIEQRFAELAQRLERGGAATPQSVLGAPQPAALHSAPVAPQDGADSPELCALEPAPAAHSTTAVAPQTAPVAVAPEPAAPIMAPLALHTPPETSVQDMGAAGPNSTPMSATSGTGWCDAKEKKVNSRLKEMRTYTGEEKENLEEFIEDFEDLQDDLQLTDHEVAKLIKTKMKEDAKSCYKSMSEEDRKSPDKIFAILRKRFGELLSVQTVTREMGALSQKEHQSLRKYFNVAIKVQERREKSFQETLGEHSSASHKKLHDIEMVECFRKGLKPELAQQIVGRQFDNLQSIFEHLLKIELGLENLKQNAAQRRAQVGLVTEAVIMQVEDSAAVSRQTHTETQKGCGLRKNDPKGACFICGSKDHWANRCPQRKSRAKDRPPACSICGDPSHMKPDCTNIYCQHCQRHGHWTSQCTKQPLVSQYDQYMGATGGAEPASLQKTSDSTQRKAKVMRVGDWNFVEKLQLQALKKENAFWSTVPQGTAPQERSGGGKPPEEGRQAAEIVMKVEKSPELIFFIEHNKRARYVQERKEGDLVYVRGMRGKDKLTLGPLRLVKKITELTFKLENLNGPKRVFMWHRIRARKHLVCDKDAANGISKWLEYVMEEKSECERNELEEESAEMGGVKVQGGAREGSDAISKDKIKICSESKNAKSAQSAPADPPKSPFVANISPCDVVNKTIECEWPLKGKRPPLDGADGAPKALRTRPVGEALAVGAAPTWPTADAAREERGKEDTNLSESIAGLANTLFASWRVRLQT